MYCTVLNCAALYCTVVPQGLSSPCTSTDAPNGVGRSNGSITSSVSGLTGWPYKGGQELLQRINKREEKVQRVLQQISSCNGANYQQLYTTQLLQKAIADPARMAGYLNMPKHERLNYWSEVRGCGNDKVSCVTHW